MSDRRKKTKKRKLYLAIYLCLCLLIILLAYFQLSRMARDYNTRHLELITGLYAEKMNDSMGIPRTISGIHEKDISMMAKHADQEGNPLYPVPVLMNRKELEQIYYKVKG